MKDFIKNQPSIPFGKFVRYLGSVIRPYAYRLGLVFGLVILEAGVTVYFLPNALEMIVNSVGDLKGVAFSKVLAVPLLTYLGLQMCNEFVVRGQDYLLDVCTLPLLKNRVVADSMKRLLEKDYGFHERSSSGNLSEHVMRISDAITRVVEMIFSKIAYLAFLFAFAVYKLSLIDLLLGGVLVVFFLFVVGVLLFFNHRLSSLSFQLSRGYAGLNGLIVDVLSNIFSIKIFSGGKRERKRLAMSLASATRAEKKLEGAYVRMLATIGGGYLFLQGVSFYILWQRAMAGKIGVGAIVVVLYVNEAIMNMVWYDLGDLSVLSKYVGRARQAFGLLYGEAYVPRGERVKVLKLERGHVRFEKVSFGFFPEKLVFKNLSIDIPAGQKVGVVGYSGSGKSTFTKLLLGLYRLQRGRILIDQQDIAEVTDRSLRDAIGVLPQETSLFHRSLADNLYYGNWDKGEAEVKRAVRRAYAHKFIKRLPNGYDTMIGEHGGQLSGGEQQRIGIARVILKNAPILVLDEATSQLDMVTEGYIQDSLARLMEGKTTVVVAHRLSTLSQMDRILVFDGGRVVQDGKHGELLEKGGIYTQLWETQSHGFLGNE